MTSGRILSIQTSDERGGAEYANVDLLAALAKRGHDIVLVTNQPTLAEGTGLRVRVIDIGPKLRRRTAVRVVVGAPRWLGQLWQSLQGEQPVWAILLHFKKEQLLCSLLPGRLTGRIVWAEWGPIPRPLRRAPTRWLYSLAARRATGVMAVSEGTRRSVIAAGVPDCKVAVVPNLIDVVAAQFDPDARRHIRKGWNVAGDVLVIGCVSRFQRRKRYDVVIDAMSYLPAKTLLVLAGEGEDEPRLRKRAARLGARVRFAPPVRGHVESFLSACDVFVFAPSATEGAPRAISLAQLIGLPVVSTAAEGADELIPRGGGVIAAPEHDPKAVAAAIMDYRDPERRRIEGERGRESALERHDPERTLRLTELILGLGESQR